MYPEWSFYSISCVHFSSVKFEVFYVLRKKGNNWPTLNRHYEKGQNDSFGMDDLSLLYTKLSSIYV